MAKSSTYASRFHVRRGSGTVGGEAVTKHYQLPTLQTRCSGTVGGGAVKKPTFGRGSFAARLGGTEAKKNLPAQEKHDDFAMGNQIAKLSADERFKYVENLIIKLHKESAGTKPIQKFYSSTFDEWAAKVKDIKEQIHKSVVDYYNDLDFVSRYNLGTYPWANDPDIKALLQILQMRGRAKAASKLEKLEAEIDGIAGQIAKLESGGRYYREDVINLSTTFDRLHISIRIENDRGRKRQQSLDKMAAAPFNAAKKARDVGCATVIIIFGIGLCIGVPILIILGLCGVIR